MNPAWRGVAPKYGIAFDTETSGRAPDVAQCLSYGIVLFDFKTLQPIEMDYVEIKFDSSKYEWSGKAEQIHGLTREYLNANGVTMEDAALRLGNFIYKWFANTEVWLLAHNRAFDIGFMNQILGPYNCMPTIKDLALDTAALGMMTLGTSWSSEIFEVMCEGERNLHNSLEDALMCLESYRNIRTIFRAGLEG